MAATAASATPMNSSQLSVIIGANHTLLLNLIHNSPNGMPNLLQHCKYAYKAATVAPAAVVVAVAVQPRSSV